MDTDDRSVIDVFNRVSVELFPNAAEQSGKDRVDFWRWVMSKKPFPANMGETKQAMKLN